MSSAEATRKSIDWYIKWLGTVCYIVAAICAAGAFLPWNYVFSLIGAGLWTIVGLMWHDRSLMILNSFTAAMMTTAVLNYADLLLP